MTTETAARQWLERLPQLSPEKVLERFLPMLGQAWEAKKALFTAEDKEDAITNALVVDIIKQVRSRIDKGENIPWSVRPQVPVLAERSNGTGEIIGYCDLIIDLGGNREYIHECKRLWVEGKRNRTFTKAARLYVQQGLFRFLQPSKEHPTEYAQYDAWQGFAGMIGYVMDGRVPNACGAVRAAALKYAPPQEMTSPGPSACEATTSLHFQSTHQDCTGKAVQVHHLFLGLLTKR